MQLEELVHDVRLIVLLDSGSTHNFIDTTAARRANITLLHHTGIHIVVAIGHHLTSPGGCKGLNISIDDEPFAIDYYGLDLGSYDMVLGVQWLELLGPILWDFGKCTMAFVRAGHRVLWTAAGAPATTPSLCSTSVDLMNFSKPSPLCLSSHPSYCHHASTRIGSNYCHTPLQWRCVVIVTDMHRKPSSSCNVSTCCARASYDKDPLLSRG
jgi:hypothetical protein